MIEEPAVNSQPRAEVERRPAGELARPGARVGGTVAGYDTVTEGMTGWQFLRTWRWFGFTAAAIVFAVICVFLANWQFDRGQQASADNSIVAANFSAAPVPLATALPTLTSFDASQNWQRVSVTGVYRADDELLLRNSSNGGDNGFEVVTPLQLSDGSLFMVDRGWVAPSPDDALTPATVPPPASGTVDVVVQLRPSEAPRGSGTPAGNQIESITLPGVQQKIGGDMYTGAYGVLTSQSPSAPSGLTPPQTTMPTEDVGFHYSYVLQWLLFAVLGFLVLGYGMRREFRRLNADDPEEQVREAARQRKRASRPFTDEELEDEAIDGYLPLSRWGGSGGAALPSAPVRPALLPRTQSALGAQGTGGAGGERVTPPDVHVIDPEREPGENES
jgi:cytochrome oxidase assembly protein ShyY1